MASAKQHALIGGGLAAACWILNCKFVNRPVNLGEVLVAGGVGAVGGLLPDFLEPAIRPNHRRFFHSYVAGAFLVHANRELSKKVEIRSDTRRAVHLASLGFLSHLVADAQTQKGLPWI